MEQTDQPRNYKKTSLHIIASLLAAGGVAFLAVSPGHQPLFDDLGEFVLFAQEEVKLEQSVQISSGDLGSNKEVNVEKDAIINGNIFADKITINKNTVINGNVSFNNLKTEKETQVLGNKISPVSLPIANLPSIPSFQAGTQDLKFTGRNNTLDSGSFGSITLEKDSRLVLTGGVYNVSKIFFKENSALIFSAPATLNIQQELKAQEKVAILPDKNLKPTDLAVNYQGKEGNNGKENKGGIKPIEFGRSALLNFKLLAPQADVHIGESATLRGQILARKVKIEKESVLSREEFFVKDSDPTKIIIDQDGSQFLVNEILVNFTGSATLLDAQVIANLVGGRIVGVDSTTNTYQIEVLTTTAEDLAVKIQSIRQLDNPLIEGVFRNYVLNIE